MVIAILIGLLLPAVKKLRETLLRTARGFCPGGPSDQTKTRGGVSGPSASRARKVSGDDQRVRFLRSQSMTAPGSGSAVGLASGFARGVEERAITGSVSVIGRRVLSPDGPP